MNAGLFTPLRWLPLLGCLLLLAGCPKKQVVAPKAAKTSFYQIALPLVNKTELSFADFQDKVVLLSTFHSSCTDCLEADRRLKLLYKKYRAQGLYAMGIALDNPKQNLMPLLAYMSLIKHNYTIVLSNDELRKGNTVLGKLNVVPMQLLVDRCGKVRYRFVSRRLTKKLPSAIETLLKEKKSCR